MLAGWFDWQRIKAEAQSSADRSVIALAEHAQRVFAEQDSALRRAEERVRDRPPDELRHDADVYRWFLQLTREIEYINAINLVGPDGRAVIVSKLFPAPPVSASDRSYFRALIRNPALALFISEPIVARPTGERIFQFARPLITSDGRFGGVLMASARPGDIARFYRQVAANGDSIVLARSDGTVLASYPGEPLGASDGYAITATRQAGQWPVYVRYQVSTARLKAEWHLHLFVIGTIAGIASLLLFAMGAYALRRARSEQAAVLRLHDEAAARGRAEAEARYEEQVRLLQAELAHVSRVSSMGAIAASIAHELNQPLAAISSYIQGAVALAARPDSNETLLLQALEASGEQALRAGAIIHRLRRFVSKGEPIRQPVRLSTVIQDAAALLRSTPRTSSAIISLDLDPAAEWALGDRVQIQQVVFNLLRNAAEASGGPAPRLTVSTGFARDALVEIGVIDNGPGISAEAMSKLFQPFHTTKPDGMGIGLSICQSIVRAHGGELCGRNRPEGGAIFSFTLPPAPAESRRELA